MSENTTAHAEDDATLEPNTDPETDTSLIEGAGASSEEELAPTTDEQEVVAEVVPIREGIKDAVEGEEPKRKRKRKRKRKSKTGADAEQAKATPEAKQATATPEATTDAPSSVEEITQMVEGITEIEALQDLAAMVADLGLAEKTGTKDRWNVEAVEGNADSKAVVRVIKARRREILSHYKNLGLVKNAPNAFELEKSVQRFHRENRLTKIQTGRKTYKVEAKEGAFGSIELAEKVNKRIENFAEEAEVKLKEDTVKALRKRFS